MTIVERIHVLRRHGLGEQAIAAILGADPADIAASLRDPAAEVPTSGTVDLSGYQTRAEKDQADGYPGLDGAGLIDPERIPPSGGSDVAALEGAAGDVLIGFGQTGDAQPRVRALGSGAIQWSDGTAAPLAQLSVTDAFGTLRFTDISGNDNGVNVGVGGAVHYAALFADDDGAGISVYTDAVAGYPAFVVYKNNHQYWKVGDDAILHWAIGDGTDYDVTLKRYAAKTLEIPESGGGLRLTSPDGTVHKIVTINNAGAIALL